MGPCRRGNMSFFSVVTVPPPRPPPGVAHAGGKHLQHELIPPPAAAWPPAAGKWPSASAGGRRRGRSWGTVLAPHRGLGPVGGTSLPRIPGWGQRWGCGWKGGEAAGGQGEHRGCPWGERVGKVESRTSKWRDAGVKGGRCSGCGRGAARSPPLTQTSLRTQCPCPSLLPAVPPHAAASPARFFQPCSLHRSV